MGKKDNTNIKKQIKANIYVKQCDQVHELKNVQWPHFDALGPLLSMSSIYDYDIYHYIWS